MGLRPTCINVVTGVIAVAIAGTIALVIVANIFVTSTTTDYLYSDIDKTPHSKVGLLLGTSKFSRNGGVNDHYRLRLLATAALYKAGKIDYVLISGDNATPYYNEPTTIRGDLLKMGVSADRIYRDYAGFRTLDSIVRAKNVFGLDALTIISQGYLNNRALYIAFDQGIDAIAFNAGDGSNSDLNNRGREILARVLAFIEVHLLCAEPRFLGPAIDIGETPPT
ncbi:SanA/YdcF family protein [Candidatus Sororendozoicomonas aggregata]|uniref:SanA/YdcF family protein n=1 Tax=Candidatus Sororendozoicomonas aggregata TaxID=3073239 RepID=UPI002ED5B2FB